MERMKIRISRWVAALFATILVLASLVGCGGDVSETATLTVVRNDVSVETTVDKSEVGETETESITESIIQLSETGEESESEEDGPTVEEDGHYTSKEEVALYIHLYGKLPSNFISKDEAEELGWKRKDGVAGQLHVVAPGMSIGGSYFGNYEGLLPEKKGRKYYECDINYVEGNRGAERIVYSNDGLIFYTGDHYESFEQLYPEE